MKPGTFSSPRSSFTDGLELKNSLMVAGAVQGLFCLDDTIERQHPASPGGKFDLFAEFQHLLKVAYPFDMTDAVELSQIGIQIQVPESGTRFSNELKGQALRSHAVDGMQVVYSRLDFHQVSTLQITTDINIHGE